MITRPPKVIIKMTSCAEIQNELENGYTFKVKQYLGKFRPGDRMYYLCKEKYRLAGPPYRECKPNFEWTNYHPTCLSKFLFENAYVGKQYWAGITTSFPGLFFAF